MAPLHEVWIPPLHRGLTAGEERVQIEAATVGEIVAALDRRFPGMAARLTQGDTLRPGIAVAVNGVISARSLWQRLNEPREIHFVPAISGGSASSTYLAISGAYRLFRLQTSTAVLAGVASKGAACNTVTLASNVGGMVPMVGDAAPGPPWAEASLPCGATTASPIIKRNPTT